MYKKIFILVVLLSLFTFTASFIGKAVTIQIIKAFSTAITTRPVVTVVSPNGGEQLIKGRRNNIAWKAQNVRQNNTFNINLINQATNLITKIDSVSSSVREYIWFTPTSVVPGTYVIKVSVCDNNDPSSHRKFCREIASDQSDKPFNINDKKVNVLIVKEKEPYEFLIPPNKCYKQACNYDPNFYWFNGDNFLKKFYETHDDKYDFLAVFPQKEMKTNSYYPVNFNVKGIGNDNVVTKNQYTSKLLTIPILDFYRTYKATSTVYYTLLNGVLFHEIGHQWCCNIDGVYGAPQGHWTNNLDLFNGNIDKFDPQGYAHWVIKDNKEFCIDQGTASKFSNLTLYLMGLVGSENVLPIKVHEFEKKEGNDYYNTWGPSCGEDHKFTNTREVTIKDIITKNGVRIPDYTQSQKDFTISFVVVVPYDSEVNQGFVDYIGKYMNATPAAWLDMTNKHSTMQIVN